MCPIKLTLRRGRSIIILATFLAMTACDSTSNDPQDIVNSSSSDSGEVLTDEPTNNVTSTSFNNSEVLTERFGTLTTRDTSPVVDAETSAVLVNALNDFSFSLHRAVSVVEPEAGSIESGFSAALALLLTSAATGGETLTALNNLLGTDTLIEDDLHNASNKLSLMLDGKSNDNLVLHTANRVFVKPELDLQTRFLDIATSSYGAPVTEADFEAAPETVASEVNAWVAEQTNNFIPTIVDNFDPSTEIALLNAIFLDADWRDGYVSLGNQPFNAIDGTTSDVPSFGGESLLPQSVNSTLTAIEIPYAGEEIAMLVMMPEDLEQLEATLNAETLNDIVDGLSVSNTQFSMPSWQLEGEFDLSELLTPLGLPANPWDFSRLVNGGTELDVITRQLAKIEVDEEGTTAAAVTTVVGVTTTSITPDPININRPFVYVLRDRTTGTVLFTGRVVNP